MIYHISLSCYMIAKLLSYMTPIEWHYAILTDYSICCDFCHYFPNIFCHPNMVHCYDKPILLIDYNGQQRVHNLRRIGRVFAAKQYLWWIHCAAILTDEVFAQSINYSSSIVRSNVATAPSICSFATKASHVSIF